MKLHFVEQGSGPLVVLLHGFPEFWYSWRRQLPALASAGFRAVAPDLRGFNDSPKPRDIADYRLRLIIDDVAELIESLGAPCTLVGHDWGGLISWYLAMSRPELVRKLVVLNIPHPVPFLRELRGSFSQKLRMVYQLFFQPPLLPELLMPLLLPRLLRGYAPEEVAEYRKAWAKPGARRGMANYYRAIRRYRGELKPLIHTIEIPTLLIWGQNEPVFVPAVLDGMDEWVPNLRIAKIAGAGHFVQSDEPEIVNELLVGFVG
jgi:epoxide hydrolase 4